MNPVTTDVYEIKNTHVLAEKQEEHSASNDHCSV